MSLKKIYSFYRTMEEDNIIFSFNGEITADFLTVILDIMDTKMNQLSESLKTKKKVFNVLVECLQNLYHHIDDEDEIKREIKKSRSSLVMVKRNQGNYYVQTGNYIDKSIVNQLQERLEKINSLDKEGLREYYRETLDNGSVSSKGTAGLGMIDIARKSGNKLEYEFLEIDEEFSFFSLNVKID